MLKKSNQETFKQDIAKDIVLVDFFATWCGPCRMLGPVLEELSEKYNIVKVDVDEAPDLAKEYGIMSIPTLILFKDGVEIKKQVGFLPKDELEQFITCQ